MNGRVIHTPGPPLHSCKPPGADVEYATFEHRIGTVWRCDCEVVWVVRWIPAKDYGTLTRAAHAEWCRESPRERRQRLGISVWRAALGRLMGVTS